MTPAMRTARTSSSRKCATATAAAMRPIAVRWYASSVRSLARLNLTSGSMSAQAPVEVGDQVVGGLDPDAEPDQVTRDLQVGAGHARVRHPPRVLDQRLDSAQRLAQREDLGPAADVE